MKNIPILILLIICNNAIAQDVLINTPKLEFDKSIISTTVKADSLNLRDPGFIQGIQKNSNFRNRAVYDSQEFINQPKLENSKMESLVTGIAGVTATQQNQIDFLRLANQKQDEFYINLSGRRNELRKIRTELKSTEDSLKLLIAQIPGTRSQIKNRSFYISSLSALYDTSYTKKDKLLIIDTLSYFSVVYTMLDEEAKDLTSDLKISIKNISNIDKSAIKQDTLLSRLLRQARLIKINNLTPAVFASKDTLDKITKRITSALDSLNSARASLYQDDQDLLDIKNNFKDFSKSFLKIKNSYEKSTKDFSAFYNKKFADKKQGIEETEFGAFPNISYLIGEQRSLNLNISVLGAYTKINEGNFDRFEARLFTSNVPKTLTNARSLFIPESSTFGTQIKYVTGYEISARKPGQPQKQTVTSFGGTFELNLLSKRLATGISSVSVTNPTSGTSTPDDLNNFIVHAKGGGELIILKDVFSVYGNLNWISLIDNTQKFHLQFKELDQIDNKSSWVFFDIGFKLLLNPSGGDAKKLVGSGLKIIADFDLVIPRKWGRQLVNGVNIVDNSDKFLPIIRLGVKKSLGIIK